MKQAKERPCHCRFQLPRKLLAQVHQAVHTQQLWSMSCAAHNYRQVCTTDSMVMKLMGKNQLLKFIFSLLAKILSSSTTNQGSVRSHSFHLKTDCSIGYAILGSKKAYFIKVNILIKNISVYV